MAMKLLATNDGSGVSNSSFTSSIDSTYKLYIFKFYDVNPATDSVDFTFQGNVSAGSGYNETITSSFFVSQQAEDGTDEKVIYVNAEDQAQGTSFQVLTNNVGNGADESASGILHLFSPSSTTYVTHFYATSNWYGVNDYTQNSFVAGYFNLTGAIDEIQFKMSSGNFDGVIQLFGIA